MYKIAYLKEEAEADPLVVLVVPPFLWIQGLVNSRMSNIEPDPFPEGTRDGVGRMNPTEGV